MNLINTFFNLQVMIESLPALLWGLAVTLQIGVTSILCGLAGGLALAVTRLYAPAFVKWLIRVYIDFFRSIPLLVLLIVIYYALPFVGIRLSPFLSAVTALSLVSAAYTAEIFRAGIEAIPHGQFEASAALGLSNRHTMIDVILPQAIRIVIPPLTEERRKDLVKVAKKYTEEAKVAVRNVRRDLNEGLKKKLKDKAITEDDERKGVDDVQKLTDKHVKLCDDTLAKKEKEILEL